MKKKPLLKRAPTMDDVARRAGVSRVTASVALNGSRSNTHVSGTTRQRILEAARELGYTRNAQALALRQRRTHVLGYFTGYEEFNAFDPFIAAVINGLRQSCQTHHQDLLLYSGFERGSVEETYAMLTNGKIDGLVMLPSPLNPITDKLINSYLPVVAIANGLPEIPSVVADDATGARLLAEYIASKGHRRIVYYADHHAHTSTRLREQVFQEAAWYYGMDMTIVRQTLEHDSVFEETYLALPREQRPTAAVVWVDSRAYTLIQQCHRHGIRVPDDLAITGWDGIVTRVRPVDVLTTIRVDWESIAAKAVDLLVALIHGEPVPEQTVFPVELIVGETA
jgi:DNA-binding LacI/PurR family transcriptional regulator